MGSLSDWAGRHLEDGGTWTLTLDPWHELARGPGVWATYWLGEFHSDHHKEVFLTPKDRRWGLGKEEGLQMSAWSGSNEHQELPAAKCPAASVTEGRCFRVQFPEFADKQEP